MINGFRNQDLTAIQQELTTNRQILNELDSFTHVHIETPLLKTLCDLAEKHGGAAKTSGAGGGDCGIALIDKTKDIDALIDDWQNHQITPLAFNVHTVEE